MYLKKIMFIRKALFRRFRNKEVTSPFNHSQVENSSNLKSNKEIKEKWHQKCCRLKTMCVRSAAMSLTCLRGITKNNLVLLFIQQNLGTVCRLLKETSNYFDCGFNCQFDVLKTKASYTPSKKI